MIIRNHLISSGAFNVLLKHEFRKIKFSFSYRMVSWNIFSGVEPNASIYCYIQFNFFAKYYLAITCGPSFNTNKLFICCVIQYMTILTLSDETSSMATQLRLIVACKCQYCSNIMTMIIVLINSFRIQIQTYYSITILYHIINICR